MIMDMYKHNNLLSEVIYFFLKPNDQVKQFHNNIRIMYNENISIMKLLHVSIDYFAVYYDTRNNTIMLHNIRRMSLPMHQR